MGGARPARPRARMSPEGVHRIGQKESRHSVGAVSALLSRGLDHLLHEDPDGRRGQQLENEHTHLHQFELLEIDRVVCGEVAARLVSAA